METRFTLFQMEMESDGGGISHHKMKYYVREGELEIYLIGTRTAAYGKKHCSLSKELHTLFEKQEHKKKHLPNQPPAAKAFIGEMQADLLQPWKDLHSNSKAISRTH